MERIYTDMNGVVDKSDIIPIGLYWGQRVEKRYVSDYNSEFSWNPQPSRISNLKCQSFADVNGDGSIDILDIMLLLNIVLDN